MTLRALNEIGHRDGEQIGVAVQPTGGLELRRINRDATAGGDVSQLNRI